MNIKCKIANSNVWFNVKDTTFCTYNNRVVEVEKCLINEDFIKNSFSNINKNKLSKKQKYFLDHDNTLYAFCKSFEFPESHQYLIGHLIGCLNEIKEIETKLDLEKVDDYYLL